MLILTMNIGKERYGIDSNLVNEVIPFINLDQVPLVDKIIRGIFNYRGVPTPVVDLCEFFEQRSCSNDLGTRIIIINSKTPSGNSRPIGLIAERVTEVLKCDDSDLKSTGIKSKETPFLGKIFKHGNEMIQLIDTKTILPVSIAEQIFIDEPLSEQANI